MTLYQGDHSNEYLLSEMKDGKRIGQVTGFENGKAIRKEGWDSLLENDRRERRIIENSKEGIVMTIRRKCENDEECAEVVIYRGGFDEEMNRNGYGIEYDIESGKEMIEGYWSKDKLIRMIREFDADNNQMIEYAENKEENDNMELLNRIPIYIGG